MIELPADVEDGDAHDEDAHEDVEQDAHLDQERLLAGQSQANR